MFCKHCGTKNSEESIYCINDGAPLKEKDTTFRVEKDQSKFCRSCSNENSMDALYCTSCGISLQKAVKKSSMANQINTNFKSKGSSQPTNSFEGFSSLLTMDNLLYSLKFAGALFGIVFILSFIGSLIANNAIVKALGEGDPMLEGIISSIKLFGTTDVLMTSHLISVTYVVEVMMFLEGSLVTSGGLYLFLILPAIAMVILGFVLTKLQPNLSVTDRLYSALSISVVYAVIIGFIGIFAGISVSIDDPTGMMGAATISANYSFIEAFSKSFVLSLIFVTLGALITIPKGEGSNVSYGRSIGRAIVSTVVGIALMFVISNMVIGGQLAEEEEIPKPVETALVGQFGGYFWNMAHFGKLNLEMDVYTEGLSASYSILGGASASEDEAGFQEVMKELFGNLWYLFLIPIAIHLWAGFVLGRASTGNILNELGVYAVVFGLVNAILVAITSFSANINFANFFNFSFGFSTIGMFFLSTIVAFALSYVGAIIHQNTSGGTAVNQERDAA